LRLYAGAGASANGDRERGSVHALDPGTGKILWTQLVSGTVIAPPTVASGVVYISTMDGLEVFHAESGERLFRSVNEHIIFSQPVVTGGRVIATFLSGLIISWGLPE
ncbi:MAG: PQQ-binding-like beta-propeller repeat protein, partial [Bryobacteraceae bacterium]